MNREKALKMLRNMIEYERQHFGSDHIEELENALAALSSPCACGGREPMAVERGFINQIEGDDGTWRTVEGTFTTRPQRDVDISRWIPATEILLKREVEPCDHCDHCINDGASHCCHCQIRLTPEERDRHRARREAALPTEEGTS